MNEIIRSPYQHYAGEFRGDAVLVPLLDHLRRGGINAYVAGGFARYSISPNYLTPLPSDIDIYCLKLEDLAVAVGLLKEYGLPLERESKYAVTYGAKSWTGDRKVQLILPTGYATIFDLLDDFDLSVCQVAVYMKEDGNLAGYTCDAFKISELGSTPFIQNIKNPLSTLLRCQKYIQKGYTFSGRQLLKLFLDWDGRDASLREQIKNQSENDDLSEATYRVLD